MRLIPSALLALSLAAFAGDPPGWIPLSKGLPKPGGKYVIVTDVARRGAAKKAIELLKKHRGAKVIKLTDGDVSRVRRALRAIGPEYVAFVLKPTTVDIDFHYGVLELCRNLDGDPLPDFHFGYLCARDGEDLLRFVERIIARETAPPRAAPKAGVVAMSGSGAHLLSYDYFMHFGHGQAWCVVKGMKGEEIGRLELERAPVVFSGACFNGVLSRSHHRSMNQLVFFPPTTIAPERLVTLNWVHAGAGGLFAALDGDRGEMAMAEWEHFRQTACPLGAVSTFQYRLAFTSLPVGFLGFPRFLRGRKQRKSFYDVMLRGMVSRYCLSDPAFQPLRAPLDKPAIRSEGARDGDAFLVRVRPQRWSQGLMLNYLPKSRKGVFDRRLFARVKLPGDLKKLGAATISAPVKLTRWHVRHEVWAGERYVTVQAESTNPALTRKGSQTIVRFAGAR